MFDVIMIAVFTVAIVGVIFLLLSLFLTLFQGMRLCAKEHRLAQNSDVLSY